MGVDYDSNLILGCSLEFKKIKKLIDISQEGEFEGDIACAVDAFIDNENICCIVSYPWFDCDAEFRKYDLDWKSSNFSLQELKKLDEDQMLIEFNKVLKKLQHDPITYLSVYSRPHVW